jgi:hypothetical protein
MLGLLRLSNLQPDQLLPGLLGLLLLLLLLL